MPPLPTITRNWRQLDTIAFKDVPLFDQFARTGAHDRPLELTALMMNSILGVSIFKLPSDLASKLGVSAH